MGLGTSVQFLSFETGEIVPVAKSESLIFGGLAVSPDGHSILYSDVERNGGEWMLVENFR